MGKLLLYMGIINRAQLHEALEKQKETGRLVGETLVELGFAKEEDIVGAIAFQYMIPYLRVRNCDVDKALLSLIPRECAVQHRCFPIDRLETILTVVMANPLDKKAVEEIKKVSKHDVLCCVSTPAEIASAIEEHYAAGRRESHFPDAIPAETEAPIKVFQLEGKTYPEEWTVAVPGMDRLPEILVNYKCILPDQMKKALDQQKAERGSIVRILIEKRYVPEKTLMTCIAVHMNIPTLKLKRYKPEREVLDLVSRRIASHYRVIPVAALSNTLSLAMVDPFDVVAIDNIKFITGLEVQPLVCLEKDFQEALGNYYTAEADVDNLMKDAASPPTEMKGSDADLEIM
jgi:type IV pilus assembly protein PilB